jgi:hypothetical protein
MSYDELVSPLIESGAQDWRHEDEMHVLETDLNVRITLAPDSFRHDHAFTEAWATRFPNREAVIAVYRLWYGATPVETFHCAVVDGGRAVLPYPQSERDLTVSPLGYAVGRAVNPDLKYFLEYFARAGSRSGRR